MRYIVARNPPENQSIRFKLYETKTTIVIVIIIIIILLLPLLLLCLLLTVLFLTCAHAGIVDAEERLAHTDGRSADLHQ